MYKIILIDDDAFTLEQLNNMYPWENVGFNVIGTFNDSLKALDFLETNHVDAILSDIKMPKFDGISIAKYCKEKFPKIKIMLISGHRDFEYARSAIQYGIVNYLTKPIDYDEFGEALKTLYKLLESEKPEFAGQDEYDLYQQVFTDLMCGSITDVDILSQKFKTLGIAGDPRSIQCCVLNFHIPDFDDYIATQWKHGKERLYHAIMQLAPLSSGNLHHLLIRYFRNNMEWIVLSERHTENFVSLTEEFKSKLINELKTILKIDAQITYSSIYNSVAELIKHSSGTDIDQTMDEDDIIKRAFDYMNAHYGETITLNDVAAYLFMNPMYFSRYFKQKTGTGFLESLTSIRMTKALELLKTTDLKVNVICDKVGYRSTSHFHNTFRQYYGVTPSDYRNVPKKNQ